MRRARAELSWFLCMEAEFETFGGWWRKHRIHGYLLSVKVREKGSPESHRAGVDNVSEVQYSWHCTMEQLCGNGF